MSKSYRKLLSVLLCMVIALSSFCSALVVFGDDMVAINDTNFPDREFRAVVSERFDRNDDGFLSADERNNVTFFQISGYVEDNTVIRSIQGIEFFPSITNLRCAALGLQSLDVSSLAYLRTLTCEGNELTSLDVSSNSNLQKLVCRDNQLTSLVLGDNSNLQEIYCETNHLASINTSGVTGLLYFSCYQNELTSLSLRGNTALENIICASNHISELDLSSNFNLEETTEEQIGEQHLYAEAVLDNGLIRVPYQFNNSSRITSTSLDKAESAEESVVLGSGYRDGAFYAEDVSEINKRINEALPDDMNVISYGIDYTYDTGNENCAELTASIEVSRSFYQVDYYTSETLTEHIMKTFVQQGQSADQPVIDSAPTCKAFDRWNEDVSSVTEDMQVYIVWKDHHIYGNVALFDGEYATIQCNGCDNCITVRFIDCVNSFTGDENYHSGLDVVNDGCINAKDYAKLIKLF